ncbi:MAG: sugar phosphate isomerase/epimerase [Oscillospiraceae bacterium]|nr:sugar phosphate isomerase/epimerase [Oscillospiraceae bacterium]
MSAKIGVGVWTFGIGSCRYVGEGYKPYLSFEQRVRAISAIKGVGGIEITYPNDVNEDSWPGAKALLDECGLSIIAIGVELVCDKQWKSGSLSSPDKNRREISINLVKGAMRFAGSIGVKTVNLWLGQDGFDYVFQLDYAVAYANLVESLRECAKSEPSVNLAIEYKVSEPKMSCLMKNAGMALACACDTGCDNVGVTLDVGHAFNAGENPAETASILLHRNRLFHVHLNDNYRISDDDLPVGSVHWPGYFEFFYWMDRLGYDGWYSLDLYPYRDDPTVACENSIQFIRGATDFVKNKLSADFVAECEQGGISPLGYLFSAFFGEVSR